MTDRNNLTEEEIKEIQQKAYYLDKLRRSRGSVSEDDWNKAIEEIKREKYPRKYKIKQIINWTGFKEKKLWDLIQLLLIPSLLLWGGNAFQEATKHKEMVAADNKDKQEKLTKYLDEMSVLLGKNLLLSKLGSSNKKINDPVLAAAQAKTVVALTSLDSTRQNSVLQFLESSTLNGLDGERGLLFRAKMYKAKLNGADLTKAKMIQAFLQNGNLISADLTGADLRSIDLENADLTKATLFESDLRRAQLMNATFIEANLAKADLTKADLTGANMKGANLDRAILIGVDLYGVKNLTKEQLGIGVENSDKEKGKLSKYPYLCHIINLPENIKKGMKPELLKSYLNQDCERLKGHLLIRYKNRNEAMYQNMKKLNKQVDSVVAEQDNKKALDDFKQEIAQATINNPECVILIPGDKYKDSCNAIFQFSPLKSSSD
jgi:uncharacterized protein YjbI with pentapeptide repeats